MASVGALRTFGAPAPLTLVVRPHMGAVVLAGSFAASLIIAFWIFAASGYSKWFAFVAAIVIGPILWGCAIGLYLSVNDPCVSENVSTCDD